ncbi:MAG: ATPase, T2SS/T4P/T4SS family [Bdellovibrionota bacterium]
MSRQLAEILLKEHIIAQSQFDEAAHASKSLNKSYIRFFLEKKYVTETKLLYFLGQKFGLASINLAKFEIAPEILRLFNPDQARKFNVIPIQSNKGTLVVALCDPTLIGNLEQIKFMIKHNVEAVLTTYSAFDGAMQKYYGGSAIVGAAIETFQRNTAEEERKAKGKTAEGTLAIELTQVHDVDQGGMDQDAPVITLVNGILTEAIRRGASDIHVEPYEKRFRVRLRVDGTLIEVAEIPLAMRRAAVTRFKIMSRMDIAESRIPQDGRIKLRASGNDIDFRVSTMPTLFGEKVVLRLLGKGNLNADISKAGFDARQFEVFKKGIYAPNGMVLVTGPTGSGKTTTLYSALSELNKIGDNLSTAEDPVEYNLEGINQVQVQKDIGLTFASVLRTLLRQDPDTILVGEIRDYETAEVAVQAALTGHLVLSTLHTNDAPSTIIRLMNMGVEPFLVVASLNTIVAQRLLRTVCPGCKTESTYPLEKLVKLGIPESDARVMKMVTGKGCVKCGNTGYKGRCAIFEVLDFTPTLKEMVLRGESALEIKKQAMKEGMKTLRMSAFSRVAEGRTTIEEALLSTMEG